MAQEARTHQVANWQKLGGGLASGPAATSWGKDETEVWAILEDGQLHDTYWDGRAWHEWHTLGSPDGVDLIGQPAAAARGPDRIDVFAIGDDGKLWRRWWDGTEWVPWQQVVEAPLGVEQVAADWIGGRLDLYARDDSGDLWYIALSA